ncbi:MAG: helix-turn-helix transcriptional regulator [Clostridia bacterium]|nr:helix-turn-helix transcriptional regulator [Clostridia bacterium]
MEFTRIKALWRENKGFHLVRQSTGDEYIFIHLLSPVRVMLGGEWTEAREGACILYDKNAYQELIAEERPLLHDYFHLTGNISELMERLGLSFSTIYYPQNTEAVTAIIQQIEQECLKKTEYFEEMCKAKLQELLVSLARSAKCGASVCTVDSTTYHRFIKLRNDIHSLFDRNLSVEDMAQMVSLSPSRFYSLYKSIFGISPKKDFLNIRIEHAKTILQQKKYSVSQVASIAGYNNQYHFIRQFKEVVGVTPGKFLRIHRGDGENKENKSKKAK